jgi:hypothetical protein
MTTLSQLNTATPVALTPLVGPATNPAQAALETDNLGLAAPSASTIVTIPSASGLATLETYTPDGTLASAPPVLTTTSDSRDTITYEMMGNYTAQTMAGHFYGLGSALLDRFKTTGSDYSQSVGVSSASGASDVSGAGGVAASSQKPQGEISLTVKTKSGVTVEIDLDSEDGSLSASIKSSGKLTDSERQALAQLSDGFQQAIDGLGQVPPQLDLSGLTQFDTSSLASVNFQYNVTNDGNANISASYTQDSASRSLSVNSASGSMSVKVDTSNSALWGTSAERAASVASYLKQFDNAQSRGHGNAALMSMFEDGFSQMNQDYGTPSGQTLPGTGYAPWLQQSDQAMLTGLGDFSASITDATTSPNPIRPGEVDGFSYQVSQTTSLHGSLLTGGISQQQQSHLSASYHEALTGGGEPVLTSSMSSQNYDYVQIDDSASSTVQIETDRGALLDATLRQSADQNTRDEKYVQGRLTSDVTTPKDTSDTSNLLALLKPLLDNDAAARDAPAWQQALAQVHQSILLNASV